MSAMSWGVITLPSGSSLPFQITDTDIDNTGKKSAATDEMGQTTDEAIVSVTRKRTFKGFVKCATQGTLPTLTSYDAGGSLTIASNDVGSGAYLIDSLKVTQKGGDAIGITIEASRTDASKIYTYVAGSEPVAVTAST